MTPAMRDVLGFIESHYAQHRTGPTYEEIRRHMGYSSRSMAHRQVETLLDRGYLRRTGHGARCIVPAGSDLRDFPTEALIAELSRRGCIHART